MRYMFDTCTLSDFAWRRYPRLDHTVKKQDRKSICISSIAVAEIEFGSYLVRERVRLRDAVSFALTPFQIVAFDANAAMRYGGIRALLQRQGKTIGPLELLIGVHALAINATLITSNLSEFKRIPGLKCEDWR